MLKDYIYDNKFQIYIINNYIDIINYREVVSFSDSKIIIKSDSNELYINGEDLIINKLLSDELLVKGIIKNIEFR